MAFMLKDMATSKIGMSFILLLLCAAIMPFTVLQFGSAGLEVDQPTRGGGGGGGGIGGGGHGGGGGGNYGGGNIGGGGNRPGGGNSPPGPGAGYLPGPGVSQPTARPGLSRTLS